MKVKEIVLGFLLILSSAYALSALTAELTDNSYVTVAWNTQAENNIVGYHIYRSESADLTTAIRVTSNIIPAYNGNEPHFYYFYDYEIAFDAIFYYWLESMDTNGIYAFCGPVSVSTETVIELSSFSSLFLTDYCLQLTWTTPSETNVLGYNVYRNTVQNSATSTRLNSSIIAGTNTSQPASYNFNDEDFVYNSSYFYWIEEIKSNGTNFLSDPLFVSSLNGLYLVDFSVDFLNQSFNKLTWSTQADSNLIGYNVFRNTTPDLTEAILLNNSIIADSDTSQFATYLFEDHELTPNATYYYWLEAITTDGISTCYGPVTGSNVSDIIHNSDNAPNSAKDMVLNNYPNPFNPSTQFSFNLSQNKNIELLIYNTKGQLVKTVFKGYLNKGLHNEFLWNGKNEKNTNVCSGIYYLFLKTSDGGAVKKITLIK